MRGGESIPASRVALGLVSLALVLWLLVQQVDAVSPGPLTATHGEEPALSARDGCARCHGTLGRSMADACAECHAQVERDIRAERGFHGTLAGLDARECSRCHAEHAGEEFALVSARSFARAGFPTRADYDHSALDFLLEGRHAELACAQCHPQADAVRLAPGEARFSGLDQGCQACHEDVHEGRIARACGDCHGQEHPFALVVSFRHERFESECAHASVACTQCHPEGGAHDTELLAGWTPPDCARPCASCHAAPHGAAFLAAADVLAGVAEGDGCSACHSEGHASFAGHLAATPPAMHAATGFELDRPHDSLACEACHLVMNGDQAGFAVQDPARTQDDCGACHGDPHAGEFAGSPAGARGCLACHARERFEPSVFGLEEHARTLFPLVGSHAAVACGRCHPNAGDGRPPRFAAIPAECSDCHADAHRGAFAAAANPEGCARCHEPTLFAAFLEPAFEHASWAGFALDGSHARAECTSCHRPSPTADENGRTFGFVRDVFGEPSTRCGTCHADVHDGRFDRPGLPTELSGRVGCARCHTTETFAAAAWTEQGSSEHESWTGYPLADFHTDVACDACHVPLSRPDEHGRSFGRAPTRCADCHVDPHVAQFAVAGATDCTRCHLDAGGLAFDHQRDSRYALDEVHAALACAACHVPWPLPGGGEAVRYKPLGTECADCHDPGFLERAEASRRTGRRTGFAPRGEGP